MERSLGHPHAVLANQRVPPNRRVKRKRLSLTTAKRLAQLSPLQRTLAFSVTPNRRKDLSMKVVFFIGMFLFLASFAWAGEKSVVPPCHPLLNCPEVEPLPVVHFQEIVRLPLVEPLETTRTLVWHGLSCLPAVTVASSGRNLLPWVSHPDSLYFIVNVFNLGSDAVRPDALVTYWCPGD